MAEKKQKTKKTIPGKKLPGMFRKIYTEKSFQKKILRNIYIDADAKLVKNIFNAGKDKKGRKILQTDVNRAYDTAEYKHLKIIAKQINRQKPGIKLVPLFATVIFVAAGCGTFTLFKNVLLKKMLVSSMEGIFKVETDVRRVNLQLLDACLEIYDLQQTNPGDVTRNLFEIDNIKVDFNLNDLLRGKFHAEKIAVEGVALGTERKFPGKVIEKTKKEKKKNKKPGKGDEFTKIAVEKLQTMFASYNPENLIGSIQSQLKSPDYAKNVTEEVNKAVVKWQAEPEKIQKSVTDFSLSVQKVVSTDWSKINTPEKIRETLEIINTAITQGQSLQKNIENTVKEIQEDSEKVKTISHELTVTLDADKKLIERKVAELKHMFSPQGVQEIMNASIQAGLYRYTGKFYPYVEKVLEFAESSKGQELKKKNAEKKAAKKEAEVARKARQKSRKRLPGTDIYYRKDTVPKLYVENVVASGYEKDSDKLLFKAELSNISSDQDMAGKSSAVYADFRVMGNPNSVKIIIDSRSSSKEPLINASYIGKGWTVQGDSGAFSLKSKAEIKAGMVADSLNNFKITGDIDLAVSEITGMDFEPAAISRIYNKSLSGIKNLSIGFEAGLDENGEIVLRIPNLEKLSRQLANPVINALTEEINVIANETKAEVIRVLSEKTGIASDSIEKFTDISSSVEESRKMLDQLQKELDKKKNELQKSLESKAKEATEAASKEFKKAAEQAAVEAQKAAEDAAKKALKGLFGR